MKNVLLMLLLILVSCGGNTPEPTPETLTVQITPGAALLTKTGETKALTAKVLNSSGNVVEKAITWTSSNPETVQISSDGVITALKDVGSSQIMASAGNQKSIPLLVTVIETLPNTILLTDSQIVGTVVAVNPEIDDITKLEYDVMLTGLAMPEVGSIVLNSETKPLAGKVLSVQPVGNDFKVRLRGDAPGKLVKHFELNQTIDLSGTKPELPEDIAALYDTSFQNGEYIFTPKPGAKPQAARVSTKGISEGKIGPFKCEFAYPYTPVTLGILPTFSMVFNPIAKYTSKSENGVDKFARIEIGAEPTIKLQAQMTINFDATLIITCEANFFNVTLPIPAFLNLVGPKVKGGVGFEFQPKATLLNYGLKMALESKSRITFGLDCTNDCAVFSNFDNLTPLADIAKFTPVLPETNGPARIELTSTAYGFINFGFGVPLIDSLGIDLIGISVGVKDEYNWSTLKSQANATDYKSSHKDSLYAEASLGRKILGDPELKADGSKTLLSLLNYMGIFRWNIAKVGVQKLIIDTPVATALTTDVVTPLEAGKTYNFKVSLDPKTATPFNYYGVDTVSVYTFANDEAIKLTEAKANPNQVEFSLNWTVPANPLFVNSSPKFFAFVTQKGLTSFAELELGEFITQRLTGSFDFNYMSTSSGYIITGGEQFSPYAAWTEIDEGKGDTTQHFKATIIPESVQYEEAGIAETIGSADLEITEAQYTNNSSNNFYSTKVFTNFKCSNNSFSNLRQEIFILNVDKDKLLGKVSFTLVRSIPPKIKVNSVILKTKNLQPVTTGQVTFNESAVGVFSAQGNESCGSLITKSNQSTAFSDSIRMFFPSEKVVELSLGMGELTYLSENFTSNLPDQGETIMSTGIIKWDLRF
jgi:hypothetical protein